jgi:hypothetical protein
MNGKNITSTLNGCHSMPSLRVTSRCDQVVSTPSYLEVPGSNLGGQNAAQAEAPLFLGAFT